MASGTSQKRTASQCEELLAKYDKMQVDYASQGFSQKCEVILKRILVDDNIPSQFKARFSLYKIVRSIVKILFLNELEMLLFANFLHRSLWKLDEILLERYAHESRFEVNNGKFQTENQMINLHLLLIGYHTKSLLNNGSMRTIFLNFIMAKLVPNFEMLYQEWRKRRDWEFRQADLLHLNKSYIVSQATDLVDEKKRPDFNEIVDKILEMSQAYSTTQEKFDKIDNPATPQQQIPQPPPPPPMPQQHHTNHHLANIMKAYHNQPHSQPQPRPTYPNFPSKPQHYEQPPSLQSMPSRGESELIKALSFYKNESNNGPQMPQPPQPHLNKEPSYGFSDFFRQDSGNFYPSNNNHGKHNELISLLSMSGPNFQKEMSFLRQQSIEKPYIDSDYSERFMSGQLLQPQPSQSAPHPHSHPHQHQHQHQHQHPHPHPHGGQGLMSSFNMGGMGFQKTGGQSMGERQRLLASLANVTAPPMIPMAPPSLQHHHSGGQGGPPQHQGYPFSEMDNPYNHNPDDNGGFRRPDDVLPINGFRRTRSSDQHNNDIPSLTKLQKRDSVSKYLND